MNTTDFSDVRTSFSADRPIPDRVNDRLARRSFAEALAMAVCGWRETDSIVIALYGPWGIGKSSLKNMILDTLHGLHGEAVPIVAEFNPWQFANREQLTQAFFDQIGLALGRGTAGSRKDRKNLLKRWRRYAASLKAGAGVIALIRIPLTAILLLGATVAGIGVTQSKFAAGTVCFVLLCLGVLLGWSTKFAAHVVGLLEAYTEAGEDLEEVKSELAKALRLLPAPLLVVIDDVDRLIPSEILEIFQLLKANADFPNVVYLVLFDRMVVENNIEQILKVTGREYLEKIVQVGFDVPTIQQAQIDRVLLDGLNLLLSESAVSERFDQPRWSNLFFGGIRAHFETLRDVNRFLSTLSLHVSLFRSGTSFEVNLIDLIGIEVLRVFHPEVYRAVAVSRNFLTNESGTDRRDAADRRAITDVADAARYSKDAIKEILRQLFPPAAWALGGGGEGGGRDDLWYRELRVCSDKVFDRYFQLSVPSDDISQAAIDRVLSLTSDRLRLRAELLALKAKGQLPLFLDRLEAYKEQIPLDHAESFITALFDSCDDIEETRLGMFDISPMMHAVRIVYWFLRRDPDASRRFRVLEASIGASLGISLPIYLVSLETRGTHSDEGRQRDADYLTDEKGLTALQRLCVEKIQTAATGGRLAARHELASTLFRWLQWGDAEAVKAYVLSLASSTKGAVTILRAFLSRVTSHGLTDFVSRERWYIRLKDLEMFIPWRTIESSIAGVSIEMLPDENDRRAVKAFRAAVQRREQGEPDFGGGVFPDEEE